MNKQAVYKRTSFWVILFAALFILGAAGFMLLKNRGEGSIATIWQDGELLYTIDLSEVEESYTLRLECETGYNIITVSPGAIAVTEADCPDHTCVRQGEIKRPGIPIICMPHRLVIEIEGEP